MHYVLDLIGVAVFAASGALSAGRKRMDLLGVAVIAVVTAIGGGTIRDVLLDQHPVFWIRDPAYVVVTVCAGLATTLWVRVLPVPRHALTVADALGLALFTVSGAQIAERTGQAGIVVVVMGVITGVAGGVVRDVLCNDIPLIFRKGSLYATAALAGAVLYLVLERVGTPAPVPTFAAMATIAALRLASVYWGLALPVPDLPQE